MKTSRRFSGVIIFLLVLTFFLTSFWVFPKSLVPFLVIGLALSIFVLTFLYWTSFIPGLPAANLARIKIGYYALLASVTRNIFLLRVDDEKPYADYFLLRDKPRIFSLSINKPFLVAIFSENQYFIFFDHGFHILNKNEEIFSIINISPMRISLGPDKNGNPFIRGKHNSDLIKNHQDKTLLSQTIAATKDGIKCAASINAYYRFDKERLASLFQKNNLPANERKEYYGSFNRLFEDRLKRSIAAIWKKFAGEYSANDLAQAVVTGGFSMDIFEGNTLTTTWQTPERDYKYTLDLDNKKSYILEAAEVQVFINKIWFEAEVGHD